MMNPSHDEPLNPETLRFVEEMWRGDGANLQSRPEWQGFFERWQFKQPAESNGDQIAESPDSAASPSEAESPAKPQQTNGPVQTDARKKRSTESIDAAGLATRTAALLAAYRNWGHLRAELDPLGRPRPEAPQLDRAAGRLSPSLEALVPALSNPDQTVPVRDLLEQLEATYCGSVGYQYSHLQDYKARRWLRRRIEHSSNRRMSRRAQHRILNRLIAATGFEQFVRKKYVGAKTFSLAGSESLLPLLDTVVERAADRGMFEIVLGMAHRGRLNVLVNILGQRPQEIFRELEDQETGQAPTSGDVRYHLGYSNDWLSHEGDRIHLSLSFNPSHLEFVNPVALGRMRAKQQRAGDESRQRGMTVLLHGDASFIGEGVVQESLNLAQLPGYTTGGTVHVVIDNQLGFTTDPSEARSTTYASDIALAFGAPVFHVNGDDAEAVVKVARLAVDYRQKFQRDVVIDLHCFRRWGHNEADEPSFTQPQMYDLIESHPPVSEIYEQQLLEAGRISPQYGRRLQAKYAARLQSELEAAGRTRSSPRTSSLGGIWSGYLGGPQPADDVPDTAVPAAKLQELLAKLIAVPEDFHLHRKLTQGLARREEMIQGERPLDWATCEILALASLAVEGRPVRLTGQDVARGTFSQRHAVWHDTESGATYMPLANLAPRQATVEIINSPLCETAALGFEYGFSLDYPEALVAWEAQFGDFWNAAQVIFDQFFASAEDKWSRLSGLVLLLPHGFEGQGPEHSSARLERFLVSAADENYQVIVPSTPAQYFHCLRRQVLRRWRKPLVVLTPKSLLRHHAVVSSWDDLESGEFQTVMNDPRGVTSKVKRVLLCMGKLYYDLEREREERGAGDVALVRVEQFYPLPVEELTKAIDAFPRETPVVWCQEEPANMGAWRYMQMVWPTIAPNRPPLTGVTRPESASPATGSHTAHRLEQQALLAHAFEL